MYIILFILVIGLYIGQSSIKKLLEIVLENQNTMFSIMHRVDNTADELLYNSDKDK